MDRLLKTHVAHTALLVLMLVSFGCSKRIAAPPQAAPPPPPPPPAPVAAPAPAPVPPPAPAAIPAPAPRPAAPSAPAPAPAPGLTLDQIFDSTMQPIYFDYDKYTIRTDQESKLLDQAGWLAQNTNLRFTIEGHADERGSQEYNIALGDERAESVKNYLLARGVSESRINTVSYGEERPVCFVASEECWQRNRRAAYIRIR